MSQVVLTEQTDEPELIEEYVPFSSLAGISLLLSLLAIPSLFFLELVFLSLIPVFVAIVALVNIKRSSRPIAGTWACGVTLAICFGFSGFGLAKEISHRSKDTSTADKYMREWLTMVEKGDRFEAFELHLQYTERQLPGVDLKKRYTTELYDKFKAYTEKDRQALMRQMRTAEFTPKEDFENFFKMEPLVSIVKNINGHQLRLVRVNRYFVKQYDTTIELHYELISETNGSKVTLPFMVRIIKSQYEGGEYHWCISEFLRAPDIQ